ncbi:hypothetical protein ALQ04_01654 [Pseudomonas cichorii]|uniref:Uncharacterized protein n=1 Tax=Pseudomonas cichorii TaxID=36746 RepID=A0A3M4LWX3_PSECI|nr:hypothetical protein [Pseudomonas cichorii]RMQ45945.1 hypothetical protein ALQ04_01654 [Pseudomonas cichorii]
MKNPAEAGLMTAWEWLVDLAHHVLRLAALCGRTYRRWVLFTGGFYWQQPCFNATGEYVTNAA